jgi:hypothetical protein
MKQILTTKSLDEMKPAAAKRYEVRDAKTPSLHVRVSTTGARMFYTMSRANGKRRRIKIGPYPAGTINFLECLLRPHVLWVCLGLSLTCLLTSSYRPASET